MVKFFRFTALIEAENQHEDLQMMSEIIFYL